MRGRLGGFQLSVAPPLAGLPIPFHLLAKLMACLHVLAGQCGLLRAQIAGPRLALFATCETKVRAVPRLRVVLAVPSINSIFRKIKISFLMQPGASRHRRAAREPARRWGYAVVCCSSAPGFGPPSARKVVIRKGIVKLRS